MKERRLPAGFQCPCGEKHRFSLYVYAHERCVLTTACAACGRNFKVVCFIATHKGKVAKATLKGKFRLDEDGMIRKKRTGHCPLCAVAVMLDKNADCGTLGFSKAARIMGLKMDFADEICTAADLYEDNKMRRKLLQAVGLNDEGRPAAA